MQFNFGFYVAKSYQSSENKEQYIELDEQKKIICVCIEKKGFIQIDR